MDYGITPDGYRLPAETRLGTVRLQVSDMDRSLDFYERLLGFRVLRKDGRTALLGAAGADEPLLELSASATARKPRGRLGLYHFAVLLPDRAALGRITKHLLDEQVPPGAADHLVSEALYLQDPDDLGIEIYRDRPRDEWRTNGRQLAMTTDPLDIADVIAEARGATWAGMPEGTRIGHVHLHVGSIEQARTFYHDALGLDVIVWGYPGALFLSAGGYHHHLGLNTWAGSHAQPARADEPRLISWEVVLPSPDHVAEAVASMQAKGCAVSAEEPGGSIARDPWGTSVRLRAASAQIE